MYLVCCIIVAKVVSKNITHKKYRVCNIEMKFESFLNQRFLKVTPQSVYMLF